MTMENEDVFLNSLRKGCRKIYLLNMIEKSKELLCTEGGVNNFENISRRIEGLEIELS